jgi:hypothetical protein
LEEEMLGDTRQQARMARTSVREALRQAPRRFDEATAQEAESLHRRWFEVTGQRVTEKMHLALAVVWRVNGAATPRVLAVRFAAKGTTTNLIVDMLEPERESEREPLDQPTPDNYAASTRGAASEQQAGGDGSGEGPAFEGWPTFSALPEDADDEWSSEPWMPLQVDGDDLIPGLLYGESDVPPFDPKSTRRWDDRASNPDRDAILAERARRSGRAAVGSAT